jgi:hypothetical protein
MEYVLNGVVLAGRSVEVEGTKYFNKDYSNIAGVIPVAETPTLTDGQTMDWNDGSVIGGKWVRFVVRDKTDAEKMVEIRGKRDSLLSDTDWTGMSDVTMSAAMVTYRQALRDLPSTVNVDSVVYPTKP